MPGFPLPFGRRHSLPGSSYARCGIRPSSRSACRTTHHAVPDPNGVIALHTGQTRPGWVPPQPRDGGVLPAGLHCPAGACRFPAASPAPRCRNPSAGSIVTRHHRGFTRVHPSGLPLTCGSRMEREPSGLNPELRAPPLPAAHVRAGTSTRHWPGTAPTASAAPPHRSPLNPSTLASHMQVDPHHLPACVVFTHRGPPSSLA